MNNRTKINYRRSPGDRIQSGAHKKARGAYFMTFFIVGLALGVKIALGAFLVVFVVYMFGRVKNAVGL